MSSGKRKTVARRTEPADEPPARGGRPRLASEPTSRRRRLADRWEPGFLRLAAEARERRLSYVVDGLGIYFDATAPSELEITLEEGGWSTAELLARAEAGMAALRSRRLSLDNDPRRIPLARALGEAGSIPFADRIVVVDQPRGDPSIGFGLAGPSRFPAMLAAAAAENPGADIVVVMDPAVPVGSPRGHLAATAVAAGIRYVSQPVEAWSVVESCRRVYVVASHLGFEAATAGRAVTCFGVPFYCGWGFTDDRLHPLRRNADRSVAEVFAAAYLLGSAYFDPFDGRPSTFEDALAILELATKRDRENATATLCLGFAAWKRPWLERTLAAPGFRPQLLRESIPKRGDLRGFGRAVAWSSRADARVEGACRQAGVPLLRMEDGFLRSIGLGVALRPGASYVLDRTGVYYDATRPSDLEDLLGAGIEDTELLARAARLRDAIVGARLSKYNVGSAPLPPLPTDRPVVLVAGQVENDASIKLGLVEVAGNLGLLRAARAANPDAFIAYKPHPDVEAGLRPGAIAPADLAALADVALPDVSAPDAIEAADRVEVATSLLGFEALLRGKPVRTHGLPFYAGWGLTESPPCPRRTRRLTLDELVAAALILYPRYVDPRTGLPCTPEVLVRRLAESDPKLARRERTPEALLKAVWSLAWRRLKHRG